MKSPFPGMDPYIEASGLWEDFHHHLVEDICRSLADTVPERYYVRAGERSYLLMVESEGKRRRPFLPDVSVTTPRGRKKSPKKGGTALAEPASQAESITMRVTMHAFVEEEHREAFVEIYEARPEQRLVTSVEVLSPSNKRPGTPGWDQYLRKRQSHLLGGVNLVEIDLLRGGQRMPMLDPWPDSPYTLMVAQPNKEQLCQVWPVHFQQPLPSVPIPLVKPDPDVSLSLQPLIETIYQRFRYGETIDYTLPLTPPLTPEETAWLKQQLREQSQTKRT